MLETAATLAFLSLPFATAPEARNPIRPYHEVIATKRVSDLSVGAFIEAEAAFSAYVKRNLTIPRSMADIFPRFGFKPAIPEGMDWSYAEGVARKGWYFCLHGHAHGLMPKSFQRTRKLFEGYDAFFSSACGATSTAPDFGPRSGDPIAITYWVAFEDDETVTLPVEIVCYNRKEAICKKQPVAKGSLKNKDKKDKKEKQDN